MIFPKLFDPDGNTIKSEGDIMNGRVGLRNALEIREANLLLSKIRRDFQSPLDPVLASHANMHKRPPS